MLPALKGKLRCAEGGTDIGDGVFRYSVKFSGISCVVEGRSETVVV